ncbi:hypothetical protein P7E30_18255 [Enterococcus gallinarum]|uniref:Uncharacterized protein n=1 Tax=Enterococcus gallinarum TaxID=1353 RepID=A0AAE4KZL1_ENTGA|nr:hypothetical protein [Enterococcus gallinarum]MDT2692107.1 hypothetical protein [Enterococcus gallinarum]
MCGRYFFDLSSNELRSYYDHVVLNTTGKHIRVGFNEKRIWNQTNPDKYKL